MKLVKSASGKKTVKMSKSEWEGIGRKAGWMKKAKVSFDLDFRAIYTILENLGDTIPQMEPNGNYDYEKQEMVKLLKNLSSLRKKAQKSAPEIIAILDNMNDHVQNLWKNITSYQGGEFDYSSLRFLQDKIIFLSKML